jgi:hypothetical protein
MTEQLERRVEISGARHWIKDDPKRNYGVIGCKMTFYVIGPNGAIQWVIAPSWYVPLSREHLKAHGWPSEWDYRDAMMPKAWDLGYHSPVPMYNGQTPMVGKCHVLGAECFYDGTSLGADALTEGFISGGTDWLWPKLEQVYRHRFEGGEYPDLTPEYAPHPDDVPQSSGTAQDQSERADDR